MKWFRKRHREEALLGIADLNVRVARLEWKMSAFDDLLADVEAQKSVTASAIALLNGLKDQLGTLAAQATQQPGASADQLNQLKAQLEQNTADLAAAITANTPAAQPSLPASPAPAAVSSS